MGHEPTPTIGKHPLPATLLGVMALAFVLGQPAEANTSIFTNTPGVCGSASYTQCYHAGEFGVLVGLYNATTNVWTASTVNYTESTIGADVNAPVGVGPRSKLIWSSGTASQTWDGPIDFSDSTSGTSGICGAGACNVSGGTTLQSGTARITVTNGTSVNASFVESAMDEIRRISAYYGGLSGGTSLGSALGSGSTTSLGISGTHTGGLQLYTATTISASKDITIYGNANDLIVVNVSGSTALFKDNIILSGVTADQVFFNFLGTNASGNVLTATTSGKILNGVFYAANGTYNVSTQFGTTASGNGDGTGGRLFGGPGTDTWGANFVLYDPPELMPAPEPSTWAAMAGGLGALLVAWKRSKSRRS